MKPLQSIAMGMVLLILVAPANGFDLLPDPIGWVLVLHGVRGLPRDLPLRSSLLTLAALAGVVSLPLWVPAVIDVLEGADEAVGWAVNLPQFGCYAVLCLALAQAAAAAKERAAETWWRLALIGVGLIIALPVLVFGGGIAGLEDSAGYAVAIVPILVVVLLFSYSGRVWAGAPPPVAPTTPGQHDGRPPRKPR